MAAIIGKLGADNPLGAIDVGGESRPALADVDGDADLDLGPVDASDFTVIAAP